MRTLLGYIGKEKHADSLVEKLMLRFEAAGCALQWRNLAFCLTQACLLIEGLHARLCTSCLLWSNLNLNHEF